MVKTWYNCDFCSNQGEGTAVLNRKELYDTYTTKRPYGWAQIDLKLWCGLCDPRAKRAKVEIEKP